MSLSEKEQKEIISKKNVLKVFDLVREGKITIEEGSYLLNDMGRPRTFEDWIVWFFKALVS